MKKRFSSYSYISLLFCVLFISIFRLSNVSPKETSWDVLGYYLPLPATFIYDDALLENPTWIREINEEKDLTGTLYQISSNDEGEPIYFFLFGMAILYLPFFLLGHGSAYLLGYPLDGFSLPYQYAMVIGGIIYTIIGLVYLRKVLLHYFPDKLVSVLILLVVFATNYTHHLSLKNLETVNVLFMFVTLILWNCIQWHRTHKLKNLIVIGSCITIMSMVKPSEIMIVFIPLLWGVYSKETFKEKLSLISQYKTQFFITIFICILIALPQMGYWWVRTGHLFYDSYKNPGVGLDFLSPHILESLISYKKGWLVYTPIMAFSLVGFYFLWKNLKEERLALVTYFFLSFYVIVSWTEWWYGAAFSNRPLITLYPILAISLGFFLQEILKLSTPIKYITAIILVLCVFLNQFQWWQFRNGIIEPYRTTKEYYWATFLKTNVDEGDKKLLSVYRDFGENHVFRNPEDYVITKEEKFDFEDNSQEGKFSFEKDMLYLPLFEKSFNTITNKDHLWIEAEIDYDMNSEDELLAPLLVISIQRKEGEYGYYARQLKGVSDTATESFKYQLPYLTPSLRNSKDRVKVYIWNKNKSQCEIHNVRIKFFEKK